MKQLYKFIFFSLFIISYSSIGQTFVTRVSAKSIGKKDLVQVDYVAENLELADFKLPVFRGWVVQSGPNLSSTQVMSGNQVKQKIVYSFILQPTRTGRLSVPGAVIAIDHNNSRQSNTATIDVLNVDHVGSSTIPSAPQIPSLLDEPPAREDDFSKEQVLRKGDNPQDKIRSNLMVKLEVNKTKCYVGEPVIATYKLCTRLRSQSRVVKQPAFNGCTVTELTADNPTARQEVINGRKYNVYVIRKVLLYPLQEGSLTLPSASVENKVSFYKASNINFRDLYYNPYGPDVEETQVTLTNSPVTIDVIPLPAGAPANFSGAIGTFHLGGIINDHKPLSSKSTSKLEVVIEGEGNLQQVKAPTIQWPQGFEGFDASEQDDLDKNSPGLNVTKTFTYPFVISQPGTYTLPPVYFNYFNPTTAKYVTISTEPVRVNVAKGSSAVFTSVNRGNDQEFQTHLFIILAGALVAVAIGLLWYNRKHAPKPAVAAAAAPAVAVVQPVVEERPTEEYIRKIRDLNPLENNGFYKHLQKNIHDYLSVKYNIVGSPDIDHIAAAHPADAETLVKLRSLMNDCSVGMYTPMFNTEEEMQHRLLAIELLTRLERS